MAPSVSAETMEKARRLSTLVPTLSRARDKQTGIQYVIFPASDDPKRGHGTNGLFCSCQGWARHRICSHVIAYNLCKQQAEAEIIELAQARGQRCTTKGCEERSTTRTGRCERHFREMVERLGI